MRGDEAKRKRRKKKEAFGAGRPAATSPTDVLSARRLVAWRVLAGRVLTAGRQLLGVDDFGGILLPRGNFHAPPHHGECPPAETQRARD